MFTTIDKALIAFLTPIILSGLSSVGILPDMTVGEAIPLIISSIIVAAMVWLVPNKKG